MRFYEANLDVSIHVPTRGTTWSRNDDQLRISGFNPRSHEGNDKSVMTWLRVSFLFQSTFPRGERRAFLSRIIQLGAVSIHVPTRGTTLSLYWNGHKVGVSIHVPTRGTTFRQEPGKGGSYVSIHVPTRGTTQFFIYSFRDRHVSIHVPTRGTTIPGVSLWIELISFNPRSHEGNDEISI